MITSIAESQRVIKCRAARAAKTSGYQCSTIKTKKKSMLTGLLDDISHALAVGWSNCGLKYPEINFAQFWRRKSAVKLILLPMLQIIKKTTPANLLYENYFQKCSRFLAFLFSNTILTIHSRARWFWKKSQKVPAFWKIGAVTVIRLSGCILIPPCTSLTCRCFSLGVENAKQHLSTLVSKYWINMVPSGSMTK